VWDDLVNIIDKRTPDNITEWSKKWVYTPGMDVYDIKEEFPNGEGIEYGYFKMSEKSRKDFFNSYLSYDKPAFRASMLINTWESMVRNEGPKPGTLFANLENVLKSEKNPLIVDFVLNEIETLYWINQQPTIEEVLWDLTLKTKDKGMKSSYFRSYRNIATTNTGLTNLEKVWDGSLVIPDLTLSEEDKINLASELALKIPARQSEFLNKQLTLTQNPDRKERLKFVAPALSDDEKVRDAFFESLKQEKNREHEAWVLEALSYLHHPLRSGSSAKYLLPSLELLQEIQLTGDIFFPQRWLNVTFQGHTKCSEINMADKFLTEHKDYPPYLANKILQAVDMSERFCNLSTASSATF
jgi:aminopeptidase N